jgi:hypothetical protein
MYISSSNFFDVFICGMTVALANQEEMPVDEEKTIGED